MKRGWFGYGTEHPACNYAAAPSRAEMDVRTLLARAEEDEREIERQREELKYVGDLANRHAQESQAAELALRDQRISELETERSEIDGRCSVCVERAGNPDDYYTDYIRVAAELDKAGSGTFCFSASSSKEER